MIYKFFDKKTKGSGIKSMPQNKELAEELNKPIIRKLKKRAKAVNFITVFLKNGYKTMILQCIQHIMKENLLFLKDLLGH